MEGCGTLKNGGNIMDNTLLKIEQVAVLVGSSYKTIQNWYAWKKENPNHELAKLLPAPIQEGPRRPRFWKREDVWKLIEFKEKVPQGRGGVMGCVTQKYYHKEDKQ